MVTHLRRFAPEYLLTVVGLFFFWRELGTFPAPWIDEGLFIMVARSVATGQGYMIPLLDYEWFYPYFLAIGPTVILPSALTMKIFGLSIAAARVPMVLYLIASSIGVYAFTYHTLGRKPALWATALLITLSAFVNTGKPVLGEVPAFFFLITGLIALERIKRPVKRGIVSGILFGLSFLTKLTFGLILPALGLAWLWAVWKKRWSDALALTLSGALIIVIYLPWRFVESIHTPLGSLSSEISEFVFGGGDIPVMYVLRENQELLMRLPLIAYYIFLALGITGLVMHRKNLRQESLIVILTLITLFTLYFLNSYGWYRHLLPAHLLLLPFVAAGAWKILGKTFGTVVLVAIVIVQGTWQFDHRGSGQSGAMLQAIELVKSEYMNTDLLIEESEVFVQLPQNPRWLYLIRDAVSPTMPTEYQIPGPHLRCRKHFRKLSGEEVQEYGDRARQAGGSYYIIPPPEDCEMK
jgi:4-amino-4-deoxy-L-arabinose transferase-like glycosyltransferase